MTDEKLDGELHRLVRICESGQGNLSAYDYDKKVEWAEEQIRQHIAEHYIPKERVREMLGWLIRAGAREFYSVAKIRELQNERPLTPDEYNFADAILSEQAGSDE